MLTSSTVLQKRYRLADPIGRGGMGAVWRATDLRLGTVVAVKHLQRGDPGLSDAFAAEARVLAALRHPALPKVTDHFADPTGWFLVMEFVPGEDLAIQLARRTAPFPCTEVLTWADRLLDALHFLHSQDAPVVHRDLKPANLKLDAAGQVVLLDFGLAKTGSAPSLAGYTPRYAPPEQLRGDRTSPRSDLYALGATLYELLGGQPPVDALTRLAAQASGQPDPLRPLTEVNAEVPPAVASVIGWAMALRIEERPPSADALRHSLRAAIEEGVTVAPPVAPASEQPVRIDLPIPPTPLVGRFDERAELRRLLLRAETRLVTLTGPGGIGKTRLALAAAGDLASDFRDGVVLVELASLSDPALELPAIARALGVQEGGAEPLRDRLLATLRDRHLLLVLDNCEHLAEATAEIAADLLAACPGLTLLATSREPLRVRAEHELPVPALAVPDPEHLPDLEALAHSEAMALFVQRAQAVKPGFALTDETAQAIAEIVARLDGLPLAIELAAARVKVLPPAALLARLDHRLDLLAGGARDLPPRQRTIRAAIAWSHDLLTPEEQPLFRRLAVFAGSFSLEAAEFVAGEGVSGSGGKGENDLPAHPLTPPPPSLDGIASLVDKSLLQQVDGAAPSGYPEARFGMLETIRAFALEKLIESGEGAATRQAHAAFYRSFVEAAVGQLDNPDRAVWLDRFETEHPNARAALEWLIERESMEGLRLAVLLGRFWHARGYFAEGRRWLDRALGMPVEIPADQGAKLLHVAATLAADQGDFHRAVALGEEGLALFRRLGDAVGTAKVLNTLGGVATDRGDFARATVLHDESLALYRGLEDRQGIANTLNDLGLVAQGLGDFAVATARYQEALALYRDLGDPDGMAATLTNVAGVAWSKGDYAVARASLEEGLALYRELGDITGVTHALNNLGILAYHQGDYEEATARYEDGLVLKRELGDKRGLAVTLNNLGLVAEAQNDLTTAAARYEESLALQRALDAKAGIAHSLNSLGTVAAAQGDLARAAALGQESLALFRELGGKVGIATALHNLGYVALDQGDLARAAALHREALTQLEELGDKAGVALALIGVAHVAAAERRRELAVRLFAASAVLRESIGRAISPASRGRIERRLDEMRGELGTAAFDDAWAAGQAMTWEDAAAEALGELQR